MEHFHALSSMLSVYKNELCSYASKGQSPLPYFVNKGVLYIN